MDALVAAVLQELKGFFTRTEPKSETSRAGAEERVGIYGEAKVGER